ncbi:MAG: response regulator [Alphaproteobacteria bacterium]|nr:response regulator [Alphaproteobacteria bacterium]
MAAKDYKVLIVDDHMVMRAMVKNFCTEMGFTDFSFAEDGTDALEQIKAQTFDVVLVDWNMPKMSGFDVLKAIRGNPSFDGIAVVMITAEAEKEYVLKAVEAGVTSYITKPFSQEDFEKKMKGVLAWLRNHKKDHAWRND